MSHIREPVFSLKYTHRITHRANTNQTLENDMTIKVLVVDDSLPMLMNLEKVVADKG